MIYENFELDSKVQTRDTPISAVLHSSFYHPVVRAWNCPESLSTIDRLIYPVFISQNPNDKEALPSLPGQFRYGVNVLVQELSPIIAKGLRAVLLFSSFEDIPKNDHGSFADDPNSPIISAIKTLRQFFPDLCIICDVCLCAYTLNGHCGILLDNDLERSTSKLNFDNDSSIKRLGEISLSYAKAGCDVIAPSDMMDGRISIIKDLLHRHNFSNKVAIMSYAAKFASKLYGPFRAVANSTPGKGDRSTYQLPCGSRGLALRAIKRDVNEGADIVMVKPGLFYLDIVRDARNMVQDRPIAIYQVSGEYAMIHAYAENTGAKITEIAMESLNCSLRAGATLFISYFSPMIIDSLKQT